MNLASWIILGIVIVIVGLAIKATFFKKESRGGCCDVGDECGHCAPSACASCSAHCEHSAANRNNLQPTYKPLK